MNVYKMASGDPNGMCCDGGGVPGSWCSGCPWEVIPETEDEELL